MIYLLDSNILLHFIRQSEIATLVKNQFRPFQESNSSFTSVVCIGELRSMAIQRNWGKARLIALEVFISQLLIADINTTRIIQRYAEIDAYSQGKLPGKPFALSARNMGKNDLWIAATASVLGAKLLTTDADSDHFGRCFFGVG